MPSGAVGATLGVMRFPRFIDVAPVVVLGFACLAGAQASVREGKRAVTCFGKEATITSNAPKVTGTNGDDVIAGGDRSQRIIADGHNTDVAAGGQDLVCAGGGDDVVSGALRVEGGPGDDRITTVDRVAGGRGDDVIRNASEVTAGSGDDRIYGNIVFDGPGRDIVHGNIVMPEDDREPDVLIGKGGSTVAYDRVSEHIRDAEDRDFSQGVSVSLDGVANDGLGCPSRCEGDNVRSFEEVLGADGPDALTGDDERNVFKAGGGPDTLAGLGGDDRLDGDGGDDTLDGGPGRDQCHGAKGTDTAKSCATQTDVPRL